jgi:ParB-like chromosome segregation protein Spo0J
MSRSVREEAVIREEDITGIHEAAALFPEMEDEEVRELAEDMKRNGQLVPILVTRDRHLLDGRNRLRATTIADIEPKFVEYQGDDPIGAVIAMNIRRRHLTSKQKRELIEKLLKMQPDKSDRQIAAMTGTSHPTVASVREDLEESGDVEESSTRTDSLGRQQPASKPERPWEPGERIELDEPTVGNAPAPPAPIRGLPRAARVAQIEALAKAGKDSKMIGAEIGLAPERVRRFAREEAILIPADERKGSDPASNKIIQKVVNMLDAGTMEVETVNYDRLNKEEIPHWATKLGAALKVYNGALKELKARAKGGK